MIPDDIAEALSRTGARLGPFQHRVSWHEQVGSTSDLARAAADAGAAEGTTIAANAQSAGRGRLGTRFREAQGGPAHPAQTQPANPRSHGVISRAVPTAFRMSAGDFLLHSAA